MGVAVGVQGRDMTTCVVGPTLHVGLPLPLPVLDCDVLCVVCVFGVTPFAPRSRVLPQSRAAPLFVSLRLHCLQWLPHRWLPSLLSPSLSPRHCAAISTSTRAPHGFCGVCAVIGAGGLQGRVCCRAGCVDGWVSVGVRGPVQCTVRDRVAGLQVLCVSGARCLVWCVAPPVGSGLLLG